MKDILFENGLFLRSTKNGGDFLVAESEDQEIDLILKSGPGEWKRTPLIGRGIVQVLRTEKNKDVVKQLVDTQLRIDKKVKKVSWDGKILTIS